MQRGERVSFFVCGKKIQIGSCMPMSKDNKPIGSTPPLALLLVFTLVFAPKLVAVGSPDVDGGRNTINRPDPLRHLKRYHGDYDLSNKHYWASTAFTGVYGCVIAGIWLLSGLGLGIFVILKKRSGSFPSTNNNVDRYYVVLFLLHLFFTILAVTATCFAYAGNQQSLKRTNNLKNSMVEAGEDTRLSIQKVMNSLTEIQKLLQPYEADKSAQLNATTHQLGSESESIESFVQTNGHTIDKAIQISYAIHLSVVTVNLILVVAALVLFLLHWHHAFITIIFLCWILTTLNWVLTGVDFFIFTFAADTCSAFEDFTQNPQNNSLNSMLPCMNSSYSTQFLSDIGSAVSGVIEQLNSKIEDAISSVGSNDGNLIKYAKICDPFTQAPNYTYVPDFCTASSFNIGDLPDVLSSLTCYNKESDKTCESQGKVVSESDYNKARAYSRSIQTILDIYPDIQSLAECTVVKTTFTNVMPTQCKSFRVTVKRLWSSMLSLSIFMVLLVMIWVAKSCQQR